MRPGYLPTALAENVKLGVVPVIAHPERCDYLASRQAILASWLNAGAVLQLTAASLVGLCGEQAAEQAWAWLRAGWVGLIATLLILTLPKPKQDVPLKSEVNFNCWLRCSLYALLLIAVTLPYAARYSVRRVYGDAHAGHAGVNNFRFGSRASWRLAPLLKDEKHR